MTEQWRIPVSVLCLLLLLSIAVGASEVTTRVMPAPPTPEADFTPESAPGWDVSLGYGRLWTDEPVDAKLNGFVSGVSWRGTLGPRVGVSAAPLYGGMYFGDVAGFKADTMSVGSACSAGTRLAGRADSHNLILFGGAGYTYSLDREDTALGSYRANAHFFGFSAGAKVQVSFHRFVRVIPFYVYMGGGGVYRTELEPVLPLPKTRTSGRLGYQDAHLLGLDFNVFGVTAKLVADLFRDDYKSFTFSIDVLGTVRGVKTARENLSERRSDREGA